MCSKNFVFVVNQVTKNDLEFDIYLDDGTYLGTNLSPNYNVLKENKINIRDYEEYIDFKTDILEVALKFNLMFNINIRDYKKLNLSIDKICEKMEQVWNISPFIVEKVIANI